MLPEGKCGNICVKLKFLRGKQNDRKPDSVLTNPWKALKPEEELSEGVCEETTQMQKAKAAQGVGSYPSRSSRLLSSPEKGYTMGGNGLPSLRDLSQQQGVWGGEATALPTPTMPPRASLTQETSLSGRCREDSQISFAISLEQS